MKTLISLFFQVDIRIRAAVLIGLFIILFCFETELQTGEMVQWSRALTVLPKVLSSNPSNHMVAHNHP